MDIDAQWLKTRVVVQGCAFLGSTITDNIFGFKFPKKRQNGLSDRHVRASANGFLPSRRPSHIHKYMARRDWSSGVSYYNILGISAALYFPTINGGAFKHNATKVSADALYFGTEIQFCQKLYSICRQSQSVVGLHGLP